MAPNADTLCRELVGYLEHRLQTEVELVEGVSWRERERQFDAGDIDLCWICGLPYVDKFDNGRPIAVSVAPVMSAERYGSAPVYFSDVVVRADSSIASFADLRAQRWAFNEPPSHSGFNVVRHHLSTLGHSFRYFGEMVEAGTHQSALRMVIAGAVAGAAIDSTVWEAEARDDTALFVKVRVIATPGPSPAPPWVFAATVPTQFDKPSRAASQKCTAMSRGRKCSPVGYCRAARCY